MRMSLQLNSPVGWWLVVAQLKTRTRIKCGDAGGVRGGQEKVPASVLEHTATQ